MLIRVFTTTDDDAEPSLVAETRVDATALMAMAQMREEEARQRGPEWTGGAIPFFVWHSLKSLKLGTVSP